MPKDKHWDGTKWVQISPSMEEFNEHVHDDRYYPRTEVDSKLETKEDTLPADRKRKITVSDTDPSGGSDGDVWIKYKV